MGGAVSNGGAGGAGGEAGVGGSGGMACVDHDNTAPEVEAEYVDTEMPDPAGGPISGGTYFLVEQRRYTGSGGMTGPAGAKWKETSVWSATEVRTVLDAYDGEGERRLGLAYDLGAGSGTLGINVVCPEPLNLPWDGYTADHDSLILFASNSGPYGTSFHYERQPEPGEDP